MMNLVAHNVYIPVFSNAMSGRGFVVGRGNPGIGGTQFTTMQLAMLVAKRHPAWRVHLINQALFTISDAPENLCIKQLDSIEVFASWLGHQQAGVTVWAARVLPELIHAKGVVGRAKFPADLPGRHIVWSHHPFDPVVHELLAKSRCRLDVVSVGEYQYHTNAVAGITAHCIQNLFCGDPCPGAIVERRGIQEEVRIAHIGALVPAKGFLEIAKAWPFLKDAVPTVTLEVIGGGDLYGTSVNGRLIPAERSFEQRILAHIPEDDIRTGRVIFHGVLGEEKWAVLKRCHLAIQNPTGNSEAFPASPLEAMSAGLPVIGSDDYGMADCMRYFPELVVNRRHSIVSRVAWLLADPDRYVEMQRRAIACAEKFRDRRSEILSAWDSLLEPAATAPGGSALRPKNKLHGSGIKLRYRRDWLPRLRSIKQRVSSFLRRWRT
jgi:glycosyltransferase involved in cell wall biosynthesis